MLRGEDADGDTLTFGALGPDGKEFLRFERKSKTEAEVFLKKELDREVSHSLIPPPPTPNSPVLREVRG